jgi:hypothetical protein
MNFFARCINPGCRAGAIRKAIRMSPSFRDRLLLALLPILVQLPALLHVIDGDPLTVLSGLGVGGRPGVLSGLPWIDPNIGTTVQSLGHAAAQVWLSGDVPWWNPYAAIGVPLAAEMQPSALFLPFVLLLHFADGIIYLRVTLGIISGLATYELLRELGLCRAARMTGAVMFAFNGTAAWLPDAPVHAATFLPLILLGIERARRHAVDARPLGWLWCATGLALSLYAGFPETAYIDGLFAGVWSLLRLAAPGRGEHLWPMRALLLGKLITAAVISLLVSLPCIVPFVSFIDQSDVGIHAGTAFSTWALPAGAFPMYLAPYLYGPIFAFAAFGAHGLTGPVAAFWNVGGYVGCTVAFLALVGVLGARRGQPGLRMFLGLWIVTALAKTAALPGLTDAINLIPLMSITAFYRYAGPSWSMAAIILAALAIDDWRRGCLPRRRLLVGALIASLLLGAALWAALPTVRLLWPEPGYRPFPVAAVAWVLTVFAILPLLMWRRPTQLRLAALVGVASVDAIAMFALPQLSAPRGVTIDRAPIGFLHANLGLQRFFTLGPIGPNYGAYFGLASINDNMTPVPRIWANHVRTVLDPAADPAVFAGVEGNRAPGSDVKDVFLQRLDQYSALGVRYAVTFRGAGSMLTDRGLPRVFRDSQVDIFALPNPAPYFSTEPACALEPKGRWAVAASCEVPATLTRRELAYPGWSATVDRLPVQMGTTGLFQTVPLPAGRSYVRFAYAPPHITLAYLGTVLGLAWTVVLVWRSAKLSRTCHRVGRRLMGLFGTGL